MPGGLLKVSGVSGLEIWESTVFGSSSLDGFRGSRAGPLRKALYLRGMQVRLPVGFGKASTRTNSHQNPLKATRSA